ncbi:MAG: hypothetical protein LC679_15680 [Intrasporangiaceae bacterium]|nr:hypothetical protein [Intrasporangiaceae bacterium]
MTIYSGRNENLVGPLLEQLEEATGTTVEVVPPHAVSVRAVATARVRARVLYVMRGTLLR